MNKERVIAVYRYALAAIANEEDPLDRRLGPIHLLKYAYLVDMDFARHNAGETFTGIDWTFYHFGPWSQAAHALIALATSIAGINEYRQPSNYGDDDFIRWQMDLSETNRESITANLPLEVRGTLDSYVHKFGADTSSLLHFVYTTDPMLKTAPGDPIDFTPQEKEHSAQDTGFIPLMERLNKQERTTLSNRMQELRDSFQRRQHASGMRVCESHDIDFEETAGWVNSLAGPEFPDDEVRIDFDDSVWHSEARRGHATH